MRELKRDEAVWVTSMRYGGEFRIEVKSFVTHVTSRFSATVGREERPAPLVKNLGKSEKANLEIFGPFYVYIWN